MAVGTVAVTVREMSNSNISEITLTAVSDGSGAVSGNAATIKNVTGQLRQLRIVPDSGGTQPSDNYDLQLQDEHGIDLLNDGTTAHGTDLSNAAGRYFTWSDPIFVNPSSLDVVLAGMGSGKGVTITIWIAVNL